MRASARRRPKNSRRDLGCGREVAAFPRFVGAALALPMYFVRGVQRVQGKPRPYETCPLPRVPRGADFWPADRMFEKINAIDGSYMLAYCPSVNLVEGSSKESGLNPLAE